MKNKTIKGYKAFNKDWTCRGFQYEIGKTYTTNENIKICEKGYHFCLNSCDVINYYEGADCKYAIVEAEEVTTEGDKSVCKKITIIKEITKNELLQAHKEGLKSKKSTTGDSAHSSTTGNHAHSSTTGDSAHSSTTGDSAHSSTTGNRAHSSTTGYRAHSSTTGNEAHSSTTGDRAYSSTTGKNSVSVALGITAKAKATKGFITIANWKYDKEWILKEVCSQQVGKKLKGKTIKPNHWYWFEEGKLQEEKAE